MDAQRCATRFRSPQLALWAAREKTDYTVPDNHFVISQTRQKLLHIPEQDISLIATYLDACLQARQSILAALDEAG
jgi:hypothetical protein